MQLPYLNWDTYRNLKRRSSLIAGRLAEARFAIDRLPQPRLSTTEEKIIWHYLVEPSNLPLHHRRTLDQYGYPNLRSTKTRDDDQVLYKRTKANNRRQAWAEKVSARLKASRRHLRPDRGRVEKSAAEATATLRSEDNSKVIMVDQLWLWITDAGQPLLADR